MLVIIENDSREGISFCNKEKGWVKGTEYDCVHLKSSQSQAKMSKIRNKRLLIFLGNELFKTQLCYITN